MAQPNGSVFIVPATSYEMASRSDRCCTPKKARKAKQLILSPGGKADDTGYYDPRNFLVKGGQRAFEHKILSMNKTAVQAGPAQHTGVPAKRQLLTQTAVAQLLTHGHVLDAVCRSCGMRTSCLQRS